MRSVVGRFVHISGKLSMVEEELANIHDILRELHGFNCILPNNVTLSKQIDGITR